MVYRVLVIANEALQKEKLKYLINWDKTAFKIEAQVKSGKEALALYEKIHPELVITAINITDMDGFHLIKTLKAMNRLQKIIVYSEEENFHYAKKAIQQGVCDYIVKHSLTPDYLYKCLYTIQQELDVHQVNAIGLIPQNDEDIELLKNILLHKLIFYNKSTGIHHYAERLHMNLDARLFVIMCISIDKVYEDRNTIQEEKEIVGTITTVLKEHKCGECIQDRKGTYIVIAGMNYTSSEYSFIKNCYSLANKLHNKLKQKWGFQVTIGVSSQFMHFKDVKKKYEEALSVMDYKVFLGKGKTILYNVQFIRNGNRNTTIIEKYLKDMKQILYAHDYSGTESLIKQIYKKAIASFVDYNYLKSINTKILALLLGYLSHNNIEVSKPFGCNYIPLEKLNELQTIEEIAGWYISIVRSFDHTPSMETNGTYSKHVQKAINYIQKNNQKKINLTNISKELSVNKTYLCRIFKNETGETLTDYVNHIRVKKAKELIRSTDYKIYEIAEYVGFTNIQHFNNTFKKITGGNPMQFRH